MQRDARGDYQCEDHVDHGLTGPGPVAIDLREVDRHAIRQRLLEPDAIRGVERLAIWAS